MRPLRGERREIDIEALLHWTYAVQRAGVIVSRGAGLMAAEALADGRRANPWGGGGDSFEIINRARELGAKIDGGGWAHGDIHPDAEAAVAAVDAMDGDTRHLLRVHSAAGTRPAWLPDGSTRMVAVRYPGSGKPVVAFDPETGRELWCEVVVHNGPDVVEAGRRHYCRWWCGLFSVAEILGKVEPQRHVVTGPAAPAFPWLGE